MSDSDDETTNQSTADDTDPRLGDPREEPDEETRQKLEEEREQRLDPDNRPENAEVDNTPRDFDVERGMFTDNDEHSEDEPPPFKDPEDPNTEDDSDDKSAT